MYVAMREGNRFYDFFRCSLPHRYCSVSEVADLFLTICPFSILEERPVSITNQHYLSTLKGQLELVMSLEKSFFAIFTCQELTSAIICDKRRIAFIDKHNHEYEGKTGGAVCIVAHKELDLFVKWIATINGLCETTYGNLTLIKFHW